MKLTSGQIEALAEVIREQRSQDRITFVHISVNSDGYVSFRVLEEDTNKVVQKGTMDEDGQFD